MHTLLKTLLISLTLNLLAAQAAAQPGTYEAAQTELLTLANAMELVFIDTNYLTTLENLNDLGSPTFSIPYDYISDEDGALVIDAFDGRFRDPPRLDLLTRPLGLNWQGPYVNIQLERTETDPPFAYEEGTPLDPWGRPYLFYSPLGLIDPVAQTITLEHHQDIFPTFTIASLGQDGIVSSDDLSRSVGGLTVQMTSISSVRIYSSQTRRGGYELVVNGYRFGSTQGAGGILVNSAPIDGPIVQWSSTQVRVDIDALPPDNAVISLETDNGATVAYEGFLVEGATGVEDWMLY